MIWASCTCLPSTCATLVDPLWRTRLRARLKTERFWFDSRGWDERVTGRCTSQPTVTRKAGVRSRDTTKPAKCWSDTSVSHTEVAGAIPAADSIQTSNQGTLVMFKISKYFSTKSTPQTEAIPGSDQVPNSAGGFTWELDDWARLDRWLVLGSERGTFYVGERELTRANATIVQRCIAQDGLRTIHRIVDISVSGRAPKNDPAIFSLAMAAKLGDEATRRAAYAALPKVCRIGTHLMHFVEYAQAFGGWGRGMRRAIGSWFNNLAPSDLAYQLAKYQSRDGWSNRDLLRLAHPRAASPSHDRLFSWVVKGELAAEAAADPALALVTAMIELRSLTAAKAVATKIREAKLPRECVPTEWLTSPEVWDALLEAMPMTALI